jgi:glycosyltransferase involved in cell wall biosynthesis
VGLRVLIIGAYPLEPGVVYGGVESANSVLVPALAQRDDIDRVTVLRFYHGDAPTEYRRESPKVEIYYLRAQYRWRMLTQSLLDLRKARRLIAELKPDVVHGQEMGIDGDIATRCSPTSVVTVHGITYVECHLHHEPNLRNRLRARLIYNVARRVLARAKVVISISKYDAGEIDRLVRGTQMSIPNATADEFFALSPATPTEPRLLSAGMLTHRKNPLGLVNAFAKVRKEVPAARLALIGPQPDAAYAQLVRDRVAALGLTDSVDIVDLVDVERLRREIANARAVVLFSRQETAPTIIAQAMAAGKPVIATRVGGVQEMVEDEQTGYLLESEDESTLADRLTRLLVDQDLSLEMGRRGCEVTRERYSATAIAEMTVEAYRKALN